MSYPVNTPITYTAVAASDAPYNAGPFNYAWTFDDGGSASVASYAKTWATTGSHTATVIATNTLTGAASSPVNKTVNISNPPGSLVYTFVSGASVLVGTKVYTILGRDASSIIDVQWVDVASGATGYVNNGTSTGGSRYALGDECGFAISQNGRYIAYCNGTSGSIANVISVADLQTGTTSQFSMTTNINANCYPDSSLNPIILSRSDGKFAICVYNYTVPNGWTFLLDPTTMTHSSVLSGSTNSGFRSVVAIDTNYAYDLSQGQFSTWYKYDRINHAWSSYTLSGYTSTLLSGAWYLPRIDRLADGRFLLSGGQNNIGGGVAVKTTGIFDPATTSITQKTDLGTARWAPATCLLSDGRVLAAGGCANYGITGMIGLATAEVYDPVANTWTPTANNMSVGRAGAQAVLLPSGNVAIVGGSNASGTALTTTEFYHPADNKFYSVD